MSTALQKEFDAQIASSKKSSEALQAQLDAKGIREQAKKDNASMVAHMVVSEVSKIRVPEDGKDGRNGYDGVDGLNGINGTDGKTGTKGGKGDTGPQGKQGIAGETGKTGLTGPAGKDATNGADGYVGADGEAGKDGLDGRDGTNGEDGIDGEAGATGERGEAGTDGKDGLNGKDGLDGRNGIDGAQGKKGSKGDQGTKGLVGKQGTKGKEGLKGKSGEDGVGITDINAYGQDLHIKLTNGTTRQVHMPVRSSGGSHAPAVPMDIQRAIRTPLHAVGIVADNVQDGMIELKSKIVQASVGNPFDAGTSEAFMFTYNPYDDTHDGEFVYDDATNNLISKTVETATNVVLYSVSFTYNGKQLATKVMVDEINGDSVRVDYTYDIRGRLIGKAHTYLI